MPYEKKTHCLKGHDLSITRKRRKCGQTFCEACEKERSLLRKSQPGFKDKRKNLELKRLYGVTLEFIKGKPCAICGKTDFGSKEPCVDHDHKTGEVRGILCAKCNLGLGFLEEHLESALEYLKK